MAEGTRVHDRVLLDALAALSAQPFSGETWRVTRRGREALRGSSAHGRWSPSGEFEVLCTSLLRKGALAEIGYRLSLEPIWPSRIAHELHLLTAATERTLRFADVASLGGLGIDVPRYESFDYAATQSIAAAAHFLEFDGLIVPSARYACSNLVVFMDRLARDDALAVTRSEPVHWAEWRRGRGGA
jgi:hypothetical protein